jgi:hypothetical protein
MLFILHGHETVSYIEERKYKHPRTGKYLDLEFRQVVICAHHLVLLQTVKSKRV